MNEGFYFADAELPFHVWVREPSGDKGYRWVLRDTRRQEGATPGPISDPRPSTGAAEDSPG